MNPGACCTPHGSPLSNTPFDESVDAPRAVEHAQYVDAVVERQVEHEVIAVAAHRPRSHVLQLRVARPPSSAHAGVSREQKEIVRYGVIKTLARLQIVLR